MFKKLIYIHAHEEYDEFVYDTLVQILKSLSFLHEGLSISHRDIKP